MGVEKTWDQTSSIQIKEEKKITFIQAGPGPPPLSTPSSFGFFFFFNCLFGCARSLVGAGGILVGAGGVLFPDQGSTLELPALTVQS